MERRLSHRSARAPHPTEIPCLDVRKHHCLSANITDFIEILRWVNTLITVRSHVSILLSGLVGTGSEDCRKPFLVNHIITAFARYSEDFPIYRGGIVALGLENLMFDK